MPVKFTELLLGEATTVVTYNGHPVTLTFDPARVTENAIREVAQEMREVMLLARANAHKAPASASSASTGDAEIDADLAKLDALLASIDDAFQSSAVVNRLLARFLVRWDVLDNDGVTMFPITMERLGDLPLPFRRLCLSHLFSENRMGEAKGTPSKRRSRKRS